MIRRAAIDDLDSVYDIYSQRYDSNDADTIKYLKSDWEWYLKSDAAIVLVMEVDGEIVGLSFAYDMGLWGYLEHIVIREVHRKKGYAAMLIEHMLDIGKDLEWRVFEACYYEEIGEMANFFEHIGWEDGGINTRWVYKNLN